MSGKLTAMVSGASAVAAWQEQFEWTVRIGAGLVAILAGLFSIYWTIKKNHK